jgi:hypothetical protein
MILSRAWYVLLGLAVAVALYVVYIAAGEYDRQATHALKEGLASDSQTVEWELKIDARRRLDALLAGSLDSTLQQALVAALATKEGKIPEKSKADARRALVTVHEAIPADWRPDALIAVDRDGRVVAQLGYDAVAGNDDFELGGYPAVNDALHGWLRDDVWVLGSKLYVVVARPVEYDAAQRPAGAIVGLKEVNNKLADDLARRTRTNVAFYAGAHRLAGAVGTEGFDGEKLDAVGNDLKNVDDKTYRDGRTEARMISADLGAIYARLPGDAWALGGGFAVARAKTTLAGPMGFLSDADDKDKANVPLPLLGGVAALAALIGLVLTFLEHSLPLRELVTQGERLKAGAVDGLQVARFRGAYRLAAQNINEGIERAIEKAGGVTRKPADLESILGPSPAQPAMSAFSFRTADEHSLPTAPPPGSSGASPVPQAPPVPLAPAVPALTSPNFAKPPLPVTPTAPGSSPMRPQPGPLPGRAPAAPSGPRLAPPTHPVPTAAASTPNAARVAPPPLPGPTPHQPSSPGEDDATMIATVPAELMAQASGGALDETPEWLTVYREFMRIKKQCGEPTEGLTFEKFSQTLKKNRDVLVRKHGCKTVKFTVYVKEGRASLKATPTKG